MKFLALLTAFAATLAGLSAQTGTPAATESAKTAPAPAAAAAPAPGPAAATPPPASEQGPPAAKTPVVLPSTYSEYLSLLLRPENVAECVAVMDKVVDGADSGESPPATVGERGETSLGLQFQFRRVESEEAVVYQLTFSRGGAPMPFSDAVKFVALFADRAGLLHPVDVREGERPIFYAQWLFKAKDWKELRPRMLALRRANRAQKDLMKAFAVAVTREMDARESTRAYRE